MKCIQGHGGGLGKYGWRMGRHEFQFLNGLFMFFWTVCNSSSLRSVTFEKGSQLKYMVEGVFCDCEALTSIEIPASVEMIDMYYCINLANIYCYPSIPPILNDFRCKNFVLYVPSQSLEAYKNSSWSEYYSSIKTIRLSIGIRNIHNYSQCAS